MEAARHPGHKMLAHIGNDIQDDEGDDRDHDAAVGISPDEDTEKVKVIRSSRASKSPRRRSTAGQDRPTTFT